MQDRWVFWVLGGLLCFAAAATLAARLRSDARLRRRRRKSHKPIISKTKASHPTVKFSVRPPKD
jgi:hypothetical protein